MNGVASREPKDAAERRTASNLNPESYDSAAAGS